MQKVDDTIRAAASKANRSTLRTMLGALYYSYSPVSGAYLATHLAPSDTIHPAYKEVMQQAATEWLPGYVDVVRSLPDSAEKTAALDAIETSAAELLATPPIEKPYGDPDRLRHAAGTILLKLGGTAHEPLLRQYMLWLFGDTGSLITSPTFAYQYMQFRKKYGDIPEISRHIQTGRY